MQASLERSLSRLEESLADVWNEFDVIVVSGLSGVIPGAILAHKHGKQLVVVRKDEDQCHGIRLEGRDYFEPGTPYIILDDMISSGRTMCRIMNTLHEYKHELPQYVVLYSGTWAVWGSGSLPFAAEHVNDGLYAPMRGRKVA